MSKMRILMVDNSELVIKRCTSMLKKYFHDYDIEFVTCKSVDDFSPYVDVKFDLSFIDWYLNDRTGADIIRVLHSDKTYIVTSSENIDIPKFALRHNVNFMYKPYMEDKFKNILHKVKNARNKI